MCGIIGYFDKQAKNYASLGKTVLQMLQALSCRGPDSAGVAIFSKPKSNPLAQIKIAESGNPLEGFDRIVQALSKLKLKFEAKQNGAYAQVYLDAAPNCLDRFETELLALEPGCEIVSFGKHLQIVKQVGSPNQLEQTYSVATMPGSHAIGHTRLSTESKIGRAHV